MKKLTERWYLLIAAGFIVFAGLVFAVCGEDSIIAVHDNLDLFIPQYQMMKSTGSFFGQGRQVPFLGGISRDVLPAEFSLYTLLYWLMPAFPAYVTGYLLRILLGLGSCILLARELYGERYGQYRPLVWMLGLAYGALNVFPNFGIPFASIPLVIYLVCKICREPRPVWYILLFFYPAVSYFSYFGLFILGYMVLVFLWACIRTVCLRRKSLRERGGRAPGAENCAVPGTENGPAGTGAEAETARQREDDGQGKLPGRIFLSICILAAGCIACEYRLFGVMLFGDEVTIRSTMEAGSFSLTEILKTIGEVFVKGMFHAESMHTVLVLPVCGFYFFFLNLEYVRKKNAKKMFHDPYNLLMLALVFNSVVYGVYYQEGFRSLVERLCPPLTGWQFNRTVFFSPFVWYAAFFLALKRLYDSHRRKREILANGLALGALLVIILSDTRYNDLYHTCRAQAYQIIKGKESDQLSFGEFYSAGLFEEAKEQTGYQGQWSAAYGFYPATLEYNGIATLDGYLGFYSQEYKEKFRKIIAPALERVEASRDYFDTWGARAYLYSGTELSIVNALRTPSVEEEDIYIDAQAFRDLGGEYIFSRIRLRNAGEAGFSLEGSFTHEDSPYTLYVYRIL